MRSVKLIIIALLAFSINASSSAQSDKNGESKGISATEKIDIYYFHNTRRCATCNAVEDVTKATLKEFYSKQMDDNQVTFQSLDLGDESSKDLINKYKVSGPTLIFVSDSEIINLTNEGFMYARTKPEKFKEKIKKSIDKMLDLK